MAESSPDSDRPLQPPIDNLGQIRQLPGACSQVWEIGFMLRAVPPARDALIEHTLYTPSPHPARVVRTYLMSGLLLDRISLSLEELASAVTAERRGLTPAMARTPLAERRFTFADITYLAAVSMVELGIDTEILVKPDEAMRQDTTEEMLFAAPLTCQAFNAAIARMKLPFQRRSGSADALGSTALPYSGLFPPIQD